MGFLGGIGKALGGVIKQVAPTILRAVAPSVKEGLMKITDGFISGGANALKGVVSGFPGIGGLLAKGIDWGADKLQGLVGKGFDQLLQKLMGTPTQIPGAPEGTTGALPQAGTPERAQVAAAATAAANTAITQAQAALPNAGVTAGSANNSGGGIEDRALAGLSSLSEPKDPGPNATEADLARYQRDLGKYNRMFEMYSKIMANAHEMKKALINNIPR